MTWVIVQFDIYLQIISQIYIYSYSSLYNCDIAEDEDVCEVQMIQEMKFSSENMCDDLKPIENLFLQCLLPGAEE